MHAGKTAVWYCTNCAEEKAAHMEACPLCCGFRNAVKAEELTDGMRLALRSLLHLRQLTSVSWSDSWDVPKTSAYALERRGLVVINRYQARMKLTPAGILLAKELDKS